MPVTTYTLSGDFNALVGDVKNLSATIHLNAEDGSWVNEADDLVILGGAQIVASRSSAATSGSFTIALPTSNGTGLQYEVRATYIDPSDQSRKSWRSGWFDLTANANLADKANDSSLRVNPALGAQLAARIDGYVDHGNVSGAQTFDGPTGSHWFDATGATTITLDGFAEGQVVTLICFSGAEDVTIVGAGETELADGTAWSAMLARGTWVGGGGGGEPVVPDSTPPSAVTGLTATGGEAQVSASWSAATDAESPVHYRWRVWLTSGGATGDWTSTDSTTFTKTGLSAGAYTVQVYAYSQGGASATASATATATTPAGWSTIITDDFTGTDAALLTGRTTTTGGRTWSALGTEDSLSIKSNKATQAAAAYNPYSELYLVSPLASLAVEVDYLAAQQTDSSLPKVGIRLANMPSVRIEHDGGSGWQLLVVGYDAGNSFGTIAGPVAVPASGTLRLQRIAGQMTVYVNGDDVLDFDPTGYSGYGAASDYVQLSLSSGKSSTLDNFKVEVYS